MMGQTAVMMVAIVVAALGVPATVAAQNVETIAEIRVHGNHATPDADVLALAGLSVGEPASDARLAAAAERLRASGRFSSVDIRKRFRSIDDASQILIMLLVEERLGATRDDPVPGALARARAAGMWLPVLGYEEGYGLTYGAQISFVDVLGPRTRVSAPLTWGGERRVGLEVVRTFGGRSESGTPWGRATGASAAPAGGGDRRITRLSATADVTRRVNPHFAESDVRRQVAARVEQTLTSWLRAGGDGRASKVTFGGADAALHGAAADVVLDTRLDPTLPRNAVYAQARWERLSLDGRGVTRRSADVRGYVGVAGPSVLVVRGLVERASEPLPPSEQRLLGGAATMRGYRVGHQAGDQLAVLTGELRLPVGARLSAGRLAVRTFVDAGTTYPAGEPLRGRRFERAAGVGILFGAAIVNGSLDVAWPASGGPRWHFGLGVAF